MVHIKLICVGKCRETYWRDAFSEYQKRLGSYCKFELLELAAENIMEDSSEAQVERLLAVEGQRIMEQFGKSARTVALCVEGRGLSSPQLSEWMSLMMESGTSEIDFVIGSAHGLSEGVKERCNLRLSLSDMTYPHQMARVILIEQVYRAFTIMGNEKYHK